MLFSHCSKELCVSTFFPSRTLRIARRVSAFGKRAESVISLSRTNCLIKAFRTVLRGTPSSAAVFFAASLSFLSVFIVKVVFIPLYYFGYNPLSTSLPSPSPTNRKISQPVVQVVGYFYKTQIFVSQKLYGTVRKNLHFSETRVYSQLV